MTDTDSHYSINELADIYGVQTSYTDLNGDTQTANREVLIDVLQALGAPIERDNGAREAVRQYERQRWKRCIDPVLVALDGSPVEIRLRMPESSARNGTKCRIRICEVDSGKIRQFRFPVDQAPTCGREKFDGSEYIVKRLVLKGGLPYGYYNLILEFGNERLESLVISAPSEVTSFSESSRTWGVFLPLYSLHSSHSWGIGDFTDLANLVEWTGAQGGGVVGILPILPTFLSDDPVPGEPYDFSPYTPVSRLFWNEIFVDVEAVLDLTDCPSARNLLESKEFQSELTELQESEFVDYRGVYSLKRRILFELSRYISGGNSRRSSEFRRFVEDRSDVLDYARFRAVCERQRKPWQKWHKRLRDGTILEDDYDSVIVNYHVYVQMIAEEQLASLRTRSEAVGVGLYIDMPLGVHPSGYDVYRERDCFVSGASTGAPPDPLAVNGQNWGFPPLNPLQLRQQRYRYFIAALRHHLKYARVLRLDHVMALHRLFFVPHGKGAENGVYVNYPTDELYAILCLEAWRSDSIIVGEDLGTVPETVRAEMNRRSLYRMYVVPYEIGSNSGEELAPIPEMSLASLNTHDMPSFAGFQAGQDIQDRWELGIYSASEADEEHHKRTMQVDMLANHLHKQGLLKEDHSPDELLSASLRHLAKSQAQMLMVNLEDLWLETEQQNVPGTTGERPNWRRKARFALEDLREHPEVISLLNEINRLRKASEAKESITDAPVTIRGRDLGTLSLLTENDLFLFNEGSHFKLYNHLGSHVMTVNGVKGTYFAVWAPDAKQVSVAGDFNNWNPPLTPPPQSGGGSMKESSPTTQSGEGSYENYLPPGSQDMNAIESPPPGSRGRNQRGGYSLTPRADSGIWEGFVPGVSEGDLYKYHITSRYNGYHVDKADPFAFKHESAPGTASIVCDLGYRWRDKEWMEVRKYKNKLNSPISIYEVHLGSWQRMPEEGNRSLTYREIAPLLVDYVRKLGFTHVEFLPIMEHPFYGSWGYQTTGYFAPTSRYGTPQDFMYLIDCLHQAGIGVILDWVPSHFPSDEHGLAYFDGTHLYEHSDPQKGFHPDWNSYIFNYGRSEVQSFLISSAIFWLSKYHADGIRIDAVASMLYLDYSRKKGEWIPNKYGGRENLEAISFLRRLNREIYQRFPDVQTFAEESTSWPMVSRPVDVGGLGFGLKWDMGWMHDTLQYMQKDPMYRKHHHVDLTFRMLYAFHENFALPLSHDEVVHEKASLLGKMPGDDWQKFANLRLLLSYMYSQPGKKLLFMGAEFGQWSEWDHESSLEWHLTQYTRHSGIQKLVRDLNRLYRTEPALHEQDTEPAGFEWIDGSDASQSCLSYLRKDRSGDMILIALNFTPVPRRNYRLGVPVNGVWRELLNSDAVEYGGSGIGNPDDIEALPTPFHGHEYSISITFPPLGATFLKCESR